MQDCKHDIVTTKYLASVRLHELQEEDIEMSDYMDFKVLKRMEENNLFIEGCPFAFVNYSQILTEN